MKWTNTTREGDRTITWVAETPFGHIRICSDGHRAMCIKHPVNSYPDIGVEFPNIEEAQAWAVTHYRSALIQAQAEDV